MSANKFENMTAQEIADEIYDRSKNPSDVDASFEALKSLDTAARKNAVDALEKVVVKDTREFAQEFKMVGPSILGLASFDETEEGELLAETQGTAQILLHIAKAKGDEAHPVIKSIVKELSTLSDAAYNSELKLLEAVVKGVEKGNANTSKSVPQTPNPFRKPKAPGM